MKFLLCNNPKNLRRALSRYKKTATIEAEYGLEVVEGSVITMAHHGPRQGQPIPCIYHNHCSIGVTAVGLSHLDPDALGGCLAICNQKPEANRFWHLVAYYDTNGLHKIKSYPVSRIEKKRLLALIAWFAQNRLYAPADGSVKDVSKYVYQAMEALKGILKNQPQLLEAGRQFQRQQKKLSVESWVESQSGVVLRISRDFVSHLYQDPLGNENIACVVFNPVSGRINIGLAEPLGHTTALQIAQKIWGPTALGQNNIAGSPATKRQSLTNLIRAFKTTIKAVNKP